MICDAGDPDSHWEDMIPGMKVYSPEQIEEYMKGAGFTDIRTSNNEKALRSGSDACQHQCQSEGLLT